ncbi:lipid A biosynthesis lauroyl acyltransferase [Neisseriaceae bacterium PsAf]|nr:lipid A biosynthesis lauroyl acyltransferase [Neisseriaceae bacterium PsAf]MCV2504013.1 lipid A biosynthesis lauroyl acyltransferase [Neisseriaceae bacterium]
MKKLILFLFYLLHFLPIPILHAMAWVVGNLAYFFAKKRRKIGQTNLKLCFPEKSSLERNRILKKNFYHISCMLLEYTICWYSNPERIKRLVDFENFEILQTLCQDDIHLIILYPHFYALELGALRLNLEYPIISVFTGQKDPQINQKMYQGRTRFNDINAVNLIRRNDKIISIIHLLKESSALFLYLPDQDFGKKDSVFVPFFNISTATTTGVSRISQLTNRKVLPIIPIRHGNKITLKILPLMNSIPSSKVLEDTKEVNLLIENVVREYPEQYFWLHKRFKTRPDNENSVY